MASQTACSVRITAGDQIVHQPAARDGMIVPATGKAKGSSALYARVIIIMIW